MTLPPESSQQTSPAPRKRYNIARSTIVVDELMTHFIKVGGILVILAVMGIFVFIAGQILPLFRGATIEEFKSTALEKREYRLLGTDEWGKLPFLVDAQGQLGFVDLDGDGQWKPAEWGLNEAKPITSLGYLQKRQEIILGAADGSFAVVRLEYKSRLDENGQQKVSYSLTPQPWLPIGQAGVPIQQIAYNDAESTKLAVAVQEINGQSELYAVSLEQAQSLLGAGELQVGQTIRLTDQIQGHPLKILVNSAANGILVATQEGQVYYFARQGEKIVLRQTFRPFEGLTDASISAMDFIFGEVSISFVNGRGEHRIFSIYMQEDKKQLLFGHTKTFESLPGAAHFYAPSLRNKAFLIGSGETLSLRHSTTEKIRWQQKLPVQPVQAVINSKYERILLLDREARLHIYDLNDPHPEASFATFFGKIWYEGAPGPDYTWQSTGGSDEFEPKLSLIPLIIGTLKGTFYALLFALPIALLAAIYCSQFAHPNFRNVIKPTMEIMASLPSVVLGFLAALWLAPVLEERVPSFLMVVVILPVVALLFGRFWASLPVEKSSRWIRPGYEFIYFLPILLLALYFAWMLGPVLERLVFVVKDPHTGKEIADFRAWWPAVTGASFGQRNSLVVGFIMGFAVIPLIFTITEDALSNVPRALQSASLALGATRWQTAIRVIIPTASPGIFSAVMIGLGRAVGETMIVVMATGNTPVLDWNIFSGMRTLSANIAVELPEAPHSSTLYRTLFLGALLLFLMTFLVNTLAELLRQHLRNKYKVV